MKNTRYKQWILCKDDMEYTISFKLHFKDNHVDFDTFDKAGVHYISGIGYGGNGDKVRKIPFKFNNTCLEFNNSHHFPDIEVARKVWKELVANGWKILSNTP